MCCDHCAPKKFASGGVIQRGDTLGTILDPYATCPPIQPPFSQQLASEIGRWDTLLERLDD